MRRESSIQTAGDRGLHQLMVGPAGAFERIARTRERLQPDFERLMERARDGQLRPDLELGDVAMLHLMLGCVIDVTTSSSRSCGGATSSSKGCARTLGRPRPFPVLPLPLEQQDAAMAVAKGARRR
jgi:hypothetical protein